MKPQDFIGKKATYFEDGTQIFGENEKGELQMILDVRGWGAIQNLFKGNEQKAAEFQDELGAWFADAINEKLERECHHQYINAGTLQGETMKKCLKCGDYIKAF